jgi:hypothetical protein
MEMIRTIKIALFLNLAAIAVLTVTFPHLMVSPGRLIDEHDAYNTDCFACHDSFFGASPAKCIACHEVSDIGVRTTTGTPVANKKTTVPFHQELIKHDCIACHSDHLGVAKYRIDQQFSHELLGAPTREQCIACHQGPPDALHERVRDGCIQCHDIEQWKPATFKHEMLSVAERNQCLACHESQVPTDALHRQVTDECGKCHDVEQWKLATFQHDKLPIAERGQCAACHEEATPDDALHRQVSDECGQCHATDKWKPANYDHNRYFAFDKDHSAKCTNCHTTTDYKKFTCYECHEHSPRNTRKEHLEEGIRDYGDCVKCHRNADEDDAKRAWRSIKRGVPYQFGVSNETRGKKSKRRHHDDDDDDTDD